MVQTENRSPTLLQPWRAVATKRLARRRGNRGVITKSVELIFADGSVNDLLLAKGGAAFDQGLALVRHNTASAAVLDLGFDCPETTREVFDRIR